MKRPRPYLCEGLDPVRGIIRSIITASGFGDAKTIFFKTNGIQATHITPTKQ
jgi:hypothetical protein